VAPRPKVANAPTLPPVPAAAGAAAVAAAAPVDGSVQAVAIAPTPPAAANALDTGGAGDSQNPLLLFTVVFMAVPILVTMTLVATVLTRR
jgi:hypothetical protein